MFVSTFILLRIDYCFSLLFCSTYDVASILQWFLKYAAQVILHYVII